MALKRFGNLMLDPAEVAFVTVFPSVHDTLGPQVQATAIVRLDDGYGEIQVHPEDAKRLMDYLEGNAAAHGKTPDQTE